MAGPEDSSGPLRIIREERPGTKVLILYKKEHLPRQARLSFQTRYGVTGFVETPSSEKEFLAHLLGVFAGVSP
jgi:hypothetical protein